MISLLRCRFSTGSSSIKSSVTLVIASVFKPGTTQYKTGRCRADSVRADDGGYASLPEVRSDSLITVRHQSCNLLHVEGHFHRRQTFI